MAFEAMKEMSDGVPDYLEVPVEDGLLDKATAIIRSLGYDMEEAISVLLRGLIQSPYENVEPSRAEEFVKRVAQTSLDDMVTQPLLLPRRDVFKVDLLDYAVPAFCTFTKPYFGTIEDIAEFRHALHRDEQRKPEDMEFASVKLYGSKYDSQGAGMYEHTNIWGFPYYVWWDKLECIHLWVGIKDRFYRCVRARLTNLKYDTEQDASQADSPGKQIWGYPHILEYRHPFHFNRMYVIEKTFDNESDLLNDLQQYDGSIDLKGWLNDLFGDG